MSNIAGKSFRFLLLLLLLTFSAACTGTISGGFFQDLDGDSNRGTNEETIPFLQYELTRNGEKIGTGVTDANGMFSIKIKKGGYYCIKAIKDSFKVKSGEEAAGEEDETEAKAAISDSTQTSSGTSTTTTSTTTTTSCSANTDCKTGESCVNGVCQAATSNDEDDEDGDVTDEDEDDTDTQVTSTTGRPPVLEDCRVCEEIRLKKEGIFVPVKTSYDNLSKLPEPEEIEVLLNKTSTMYFTYPCVCEFNQVYLPSILKPAGNVGVKNYSYNMVDLSSSQPLDIPGIKTGVDEAKLCRKGFGVLGIKIGEASIDGEATCPIGAFGLKPQKVKVVVGYPTISHVILGTGKKKAGDKFDIEVTINNENGSIFDKVTLTFTPSIHAANVSASDSSCKNLGDRFECDIELGVGSEVKELFHIALPLSVLEETKLAFNSVLKVEAGGEEKEIGVDDIVIVLEPDAGN